jgi:hypothetical protein
MQTGWLYNCLVQHVGPFLSLKRQDCVLTGIDSYHGDVDGQDDDHPQTYSCIFCLVLINNVYNAPVRMTIHRLMVAFFCPVLISITLLLTTELILVQMKNVISLGYVKFTGLLMFCVTLHQLAWWNKGMTL